ncbi:hypothetical protein [Streptomyces sp. NPDC001450]
MYAIQRTPNRIETERAVRDGNCGDGRGSVRALEGTEDAHRDRWSESLVCDVI